MTETYPRKPYLLVYAALMVLLALTIALSFVDIGRHWNNLIAVAIAGTKAVLIILIFMHVRSQPWITRIFAAAGFLWLGIMLTLFMTEYLGRNHPRNDSPKGEPVFVSSDPYPHPAAEPSMPGGR
jgi:cytochrome c oxidase subunit 4